MKKLMTVAAAALCAAVAFGADAIESQTVGFTTLNFAAGDRYCMVGIPFDATGDSEGIDIQKLCGNTPEEVWANGWTGGTLTTGDQIQFWVDGNYYTLYLFDSTATASAALARKGKWINPGAVPDASWGTKAQVSSLKLKPGMAFWYRRAKGTEELAKTLTVCGQVVTSSANATHTIVNGYNMLTTGYTGGLDLNNGGYEWFKLGAVGGTLTTGDQIQFWKAGNYYTLYLFDTTATASAALARKGKWINPGAIPDDSWGTKAQPTSKIVQPGEGFWYRHRGDGFSFTENKPYDL